MYVCMYVCMYIMYIIIMYAVTLGVGLGCIGDRVMAELDRDDSKRRHSFCQIGIAHGVGHSYSYGYRLASGIAGAQLQFQPG